jgi:hypothetical protein
VLLPPHQWLRIPAVCTCGLDLQTLNVNLDTYGNFLYVLPSGVKNCQLVAGQAEVVSRVWEGGKEQYKSESSTQAMLVQQLCSTAQCNTTHLVQPNILSCESVAATCHVPAEQKHD